MLTTALTISALTALLLTAPQVQAEPRIGPQGPGPSVQQ